MVLEAVENKEYQFCLRCGRKLKNPKARVLGYGVVCERKIKTDNKKKLFDTGGDNGKE